MSSDAISKNKLVVQDDFFNEIVDGLKSPVEEKIETQDAKSSRVQLGGKQLALFKGKVAPLFGKEIGENKMVHDYVQHVSDSYEQKKIQKLHNDFIEAMKEYSDIERQADDEIDEMNEDKKGQSNFLFQGFRLFKTIQRIVKIYDIYKQMKIQIESQNEKNTFDTFDMKDYDLNDSQQRSFVNNQLIYRMNEESLKYVPTLRPLLRGITRSIFDVGQVAFRKINDAIYTEISKTILGMAVESALAAIITWATKGRGATSFVAVAMSAAHKVDKIYRILNVGRRFANAAESIYKMGSLGRGVVRGARATGGFLRGVGRVTKDELLKAGRFVINHQTATRRAIKLTNAAIQLCDILVVDQNDLNQIRMFVREKTEQSRIRVESQMQMFANTLSIVERQAEEASQDQHNNTIQTDRRRIRQRRQIVGGLSVDNQGNVYISDTRQRRYSCEIRIKNLNFDFESINRLNDYFEGGYISNIGIALNSFYNKNENIYKFLGTSIIYDTANKILECERKFKLSRDGGLIIFHSGGEDNMNALFNTMNRNQTSVTNHISIRQRDNREDIEQKLREERLKLAKLQGDEDNNRNDNEQEATVLHGIIALTPFQGISGILGDAYSSAANRLDNDSNVQQQRRHEQQIREYERQLRNNFGAGVQFTYGNFGSVSQVRVNLEYNFSYLKMWNENDRRFFPILMGDGQSLNNLSRIMKLNNYGDRIKINTPILFLNGQKQDNGININGKKITVGYDGEGINIEGLEVEETYHPLKKRVKNSNAVIEFKTSNFNEVIVNRKSILYQEQVFNERIKELNEKVKYVSNFGNNDNDNIKFETLGEMREVAIQTIMRVQRQIRENETIKDNDNAVVRTDEIVHREFIDTRESNAGNELNAASIRRVVEQMSAADLESLVDVGGNNSNVTSNARFSQEAIESVIGTLSNNGVETRRVKVATDVNNFDVATAPARFLQRGADYLIDDLRNTEPVKNNAWIRRPIEVLDGTRNLFRGWFNNLTR